jgi:hypothetical protein
VLALDSEPRSVASNEAGREPGLSYKTGYKPYADIKDGDVTYYYDATLAQPFIPELFSEKGSSVVVTKDDYYDPMGVYRPHYTIVGKVGCDLKLPLWMRDSQFQRQDLLSRQVWRRNQNSFEVNAISALPQTMCSQKK